MRHGLIAAAPASCRRDCRLHALSRMYAGKEDRNKPDFPVRVKPDRVELRNESCPGRLSSKVKIPEMGYGLLLGLSRT